MSIATLPAWSAVAADAARHTAHVREHLRQWGAMLHARRRAPGLPSRWFAAFDAAARPYRSRLAGCDQGATDRDRAEAAADDLWDAVATAWAFVRWAAAERLADAPGVEHVAAELHAAGRWLAEYPVVVAHHDAALDALFVQAGRVTP